MSWSYFNLLKTSARPVWLYRLRRGATEFYYTSRTKDYVTPAGSPLFNETSWAGRSIRAPKLRRTNTSSKQQVELELPRTDEAAQLFLQESGLINSDLTVWHGFEGDGDSEFVQLFFGLVERVRPSWVSVTLACADEYSTLENNGIAKMIQRPCDYTVFDNRCKAILENFRVEGTATNVNRNTAFTIAEAALQPDRYYLGGVLEYGGNSQMIDRHVGDRVRILGELPGAAEDIATNGSITVHLSPGCNKTMNHCQNKFNNLDNHGGFPWLTNSPYDGRRVM